MKEDAMTEWKNKGRKRRGILNHTPTQSLDLLG